MTPTDKRAEEIAKEVVRTYVPVLIDKVCTTKTDVTIRENLIPAIAKALEEYADTHYSEVLNKWATANKDAVTNAATSMRERAAKAAESRPTGSSDDGLVVQKDIAWTIRALPLVEDGDGNV